jgi:transcriptional regulator with XRE-family HTH domain
LRDRSQKISRLLRDADYRASYVRAKLAVLVPSQIRALRDDWTQQELADIAKMKQSRISAIETPGAVNFNLETLVRLAAAFKVGLIVKFVSYSEMLDWENNYSQDQFAVTALPDDKRFLNPTSVQTAQQFVEGARTLLPFQVQKSNYSPPANTAMRINGEMKQAPPAKLYGQMGA